MGRAAVRSPHGPFRAGPGRASGFTLIELLVVLVIAVALFAIVPAMMSGGLGGVQLRTAARDLAAGLGETRSLAIAAQQEAVFQIDVVGRVYRIPGDARHYHLPAKLGVKLYTAQSELVSGSQGAIRFFPDGSSTGGRVSVSYGGRALGVDVDWLTGRVQILDEGNTS
jgi:general secretion pathway protein H